MKRIAAQPSPERLVDITADLVVCRRCPRLVQWRELVARQKVARFARDPYWGRPVPGFGDPDARVLLVGLAPAAHGGNRTGRVFTGDNSGNFLFPALFRAGFANQPTSTHVTDGLRLRDVYIAAINRSAPPDNRPTPAERDNCLPYLVREMVALRNMNLIVVLGAYAWDGVLRALAMLGQRCVPAPRFGHAVEVLVGNYLLLGSFHVSQQNTFTRKLTPEMLDAVLARAKELAAARATTGLGCP